MTVRRRPRISCFELGDVSGWLDYAKGSPSPP